MFIRERLDALQGRVKPLEHFLHLFASSLSPPLLLKGEDRGFRYSQPDIQHFCLLKAVRAVSAFNAIIALARLGYTQEICVLLRAVIECTSHVEFVLASNPISGDATKFIEDYFSDSVRSGSPKSKRAHLRQSEIHDIAGGALDKVVAANHETGTYESFNASKLYSKVYLNLSNYVHCRYPETMDLYGDIPGRFHLRGMGGTPKDAENLEIVETYFVSVSQCAHEMALKLDVEEQIIRDPIISEWMKSNLT